MFRESERFQRINKEVMARLTQLSSEVLSPQFEERHLCRSFIEDMLRLFQNTLGTLSLHANVRAYSKQVEGENLWYSEGMPLSEATINDILKIVSPDRPFIATTFRGNDGHERVAAVIWVTDKPNQANASHFGHLIAVFPQERDSHLNEEYLRILSRGLAFGLRLLRQASDRKAMTGLATILSAASEGLPSVLETMADLLMDHMHSDGIKIYLLRKKLGKPLIERFFQIKGEKIKRTSYPLKPNQGWADYVFEHDDWLMIDKPAGTLRGKVPDGGICGKSGMVEVMGRPGFEQNREDPLEDQEKAIFLYPLRIKEEVVGVISIWRLSQDPFDTDLDLASLAFFSPQVAAGCQWHIQREILLRKAGILAELGKITAEGMPPDRVYRSVAAGAGELANAARTVLFLKENDDGPFFSVADWSASDVPPEKIRAGWRFTLHDFDQNSIQIRFREVPGLLDPWSRASTEKAEGLIFRRCLELKSNEATVGLVVILDEKRPGFEAGLCVFEEPYAEETAEAFLSETVAVMQNHIKVFAQISGEGFVQQLRERFQTKRGDPEEIFALAGKFLRNQTQCDAVMVYRKTGEGMVVSVTLPDRQILKGNPIPAPSLTHFSIGKQIAIVIPDVSERGYPHIEKLNGEALEKIAGIYGWSRVRSWLCVPVLVDERCIGAFKLLTHGNGVFLREWHINTVQAVSNRVAWEMHHSNQYLMLEAINQVAQGLTAKEGPELGRAMISELEAWAGRFIRPETQIALAATMDSPNPKMFALSETLQIRADLIQKLEVQSLEKTGENIQDSFKEQYYFGVPLKVENKSGLKGHLFFLGPRDLNQSERLTATEAAREMSLLLARERLEKIWELRSGLFRHAVIGPFQGLTSAARMLHSYLSNKKTPKREEVEKLGVLVEKGAESIRLWRDNQRLYFYGKAKLRLEMQNLKFLVDLCARRWQGVFANTRNRSLEFHWHYKGPKKFLFDWEGLELILSNLLENAEKYSFNNTKVLLGVNHTAPRQVEIWVQDDGHPIPANLGDHILEWGKRLNWEDQKRPIQGAGLGLSMAQAIIDAHGGNLSFRSTPINPKTVENLAQDNLFIPRHRIRFTISLPIKTRKGR